MILLSGLLNNTLLRFGPEWFRREYISIAMIKKVIKPSETRDLRGRTYKNMFFGYVSLVVTI